MDNTPENKHKLKESISAHPNGDGYYYTTKNGKETYIKNLIPMDALDLLAKLGEVLDTNTIMAIADGSVGHAIEALMNSKDRTKLLRVVRDVVFHVNVDSNKVNDANMDKIYTDLYMVMEMFQVALEIHFKRFFGQGIDEANSQ